jgi:class 3 adenylate cyclase
MQTRYVKVAGSHISVGTMGEGPPDILLLVGEYIPVDSIDEEPRYARCLRRLASLGRLIAFDRRGTGSSDPIETVSLEGHVEDALGVLDAMGTSSVVVIAWNVSGPTAMRLAAEHPNRVDALVLLNTYARLAADDDYPGIPREFLASTGEQTIDVDNVGGEFDFLSQLAPSVAGDERFRQWWDRVGQRGASPARSAQLWSLILDFDERENLPRITCPTLVVARDTVGVIPNKVAKYVADNIVGARYVELPGSDLMWWVGDSDPILDEVETFLTASGSRVRAQRKLATVMFIDVVESTERAARMGDARWRELLGTYHDIAQRSIDRWGGKRANTAGDGVVATFDMPADAIRCAQQIEGDIGALDIDIRAGVHTGEIEALGTDVAGIGVHIAARVMGHAGAGEVVVSRTVADLVTGSGIAFADRGEHELKGVPGRWQLFAVTS